MNAALAEDPSNAAALYYSKLVAQSQRLVTSPTNWVAPQWRNTPTNAPANPDRLVVRTFKVDSRAILYALRRVGTNVTGVSSNTNLSQLCRGLFANFGLKLEFPKSVFYNDRLSLLVVRATEADLDVVGQLLSAADRVPPQIHLKARFLELPADALAGVTFYQTNRSGQITGFLTDSQARALLKRWQNLGYDEMAEPEVVTTSGRQTQMKATELRTIITDVKPAALTPPGVTGADATNYLETETMELGPQFDVVPYVMADDFTINLFMTASLKEFLGYDEHGRTNKLTIYRDGQNSQIEVPLPLTRQRQMAALVNLWDNQSVILAHLPVTTAQPADEYVAGKQMVSPPAKADKKQLVVIVTATLVDPAGYRLHEEADLPFAQNGPPPQPEK